ncbi:Verru_Chthon cassette protein D [Variovorax sp. PBL-E5]|nr:Verru_Chthon cassette protein D [Variovorax sp. PBL-E5]
MQMYSLHCHTGCASRAFGIRGPKVKAASKAALAGFTLIELLITTTIVVILLSLAAPAFQVMVMNNRLTGLADSLVNALNYARGSALKATVPARVCPVGAPGSTACGTDWSAGWMLVSDPDGSPSLLQRSSAPVAGPALSATDVNGHSLASVSFDSHGLASTAAHFKICDARGAAYARSVQTVATGFVQVGSTPGQAAWGGALTCP